MWTKAKAAPTKSRRMETEVVGPLVECLWPLGAFQANLELALSGEAAATLTRVVTSTWL